MEENFQRSHIQTAYHQIFFSPFMHNKIKSKTYSYVSLKFFLNIGINSTSLISMNYQFFYQNSLSLLKFHISIFSMFSLLPTPSSSLWYHSINVLFYSFPLLKSFITWLYFRLHPSTSILTRSSPDFFSCSI